MNFSPFTTALELGLGVLLLSCTSVSTTSVSPSPSATSPVDSTPLFQTTQQSPTPPSEGAESGQTPEQEPGQHLPITAEATIEGQVIQLEVAETQQQQQMGLMHRPPLPDDRGMLFPFEPARPVRFWMKNTPSPLDMVFLHEGEVKAIVVDVPPCEADPCPTYGPTTPTLIDQVIELRSGRAAELGLEVGDRVEIKFLP